MSIGILGWWRRDNQGDLAIRAGLQRVLAPHQLIPIDLPYDMNGDELDRLNLLDFVILGGGGLFQDGPCQPFDTFHQWGADLRTPIGVLGLGVDALPAVQRPAVAALADRASFFYVRDAASLQIIGHPKVQLAPDLTFLYPLPETAPAGGNLPLCGVNLRQMPGLDVAAWSRALGRLPLAIRGVPFSNYDEWQEVDILKGLDSHSAGQFTPRLYEGLDLFVGVAFHSLVFAVQAGIPVVAIGCTEKVRRLMAELKLTDYLLEPGDFDRLADTVTQVLADRQQLRQQLRQVTARAHSLAHQALAGVRPAIDGAGERRQRGPLVSIVVVGSGSHAETRATLASCYDQTYQPIEIVLVGDNTLTAAQGASGPPSAVKVVAGAPSDGLGESLNRAMLCVEGEYLSWVRAGDQFAPDAIAYLVSHLTRRTDLDMVYTDYYSIYGPDKLADIYPVDSALKLFRANVVGPCFLYRRSLAAAVGPIDARSPLPDYACWLRAPRWRKLHPLHAAVFFQQVNNRSANNRDNQRETRRLWYATLPLLKRVGWRMIDNETLSRRLIHPLGRGRRAAQRLIALMAGARRSARA